ncbi:hypothetical protein RD280_003306 [Salmonella enterica]|nr:hypothetical protein [Salmonella enterica]
MAHKTKATPKDRQCGNTKPVQINRYPAGGQNQDYENQPFGSMPRCCSSLRIIRFIQAARDSSPSSSCAVSIISRNSGSKRNWKGGFPRLSFLCVDTSITPCVEYECVMTHYTRVAQNATPRSVPALPRRLTTNQPESIEVAMKEHNTQSQIVFLPYVFAVDPSGGEFYQMISGIEQRLLDRVKEALDEAGVAWIDPRTKERSKPATTDSVEGSDNA